MRWRAGVLDWSAGPVELVHGLVAAAAAHDGPGLGVLDHLIHGDAEEAGLGLDFVALLGRHEAVEADGVRSSLLMSFIYAARARCAQRHHGSVRVKSRTSPVGMRQTGHMLDLCEAVGRVPVWASIVAVCFVG